ncbi:DUF4280 domain-containing protein [Bosea caraganae]|uniref:DUF4280 domain-containing protein n=1 Tax=Bosea caraganae TaxID=2763117 RepID=A0A370L1N5_9HYPH|nr:DUF4280 domain-containing protein [Bosea caraganae]RDJ20752.1 DUF4280 domain-containing protein [Bosea caraganae]RDJ21636.1 DUF4280 domain-containing protein [Bosea caraganae]
MPLHVCNGATLMCPFGAAPSTLVVLPVNRLLTSSQPAANINDHVPMVNIMPFGACMSLANPTTAAATSAALGVLTPTPCIPATMTPWVTGTPTVVLANIPCLDNTHTLNCNWGGVITITNPGQMTETIP